MPDETFKHSDKKPEREYYEIYHDKDGKKVYYLTSMDIFYKLIALYGNVGGMWSYTCNDADKVYGY